MMNSREQLNDDVAAAQMLSTGAVRYARAMVVAAVGEPLPGSSLLEALTRARQALGSADHLPAPVADALRDLQVVAVFFAVQLATSEGDCSPELLWQVADRIATALRQRTASLGARDGAAVVQELSGRALDYMHQIILAEDSHAPVGTDAVGRSVTKLSVAAAAFTAWLVTAEGYDPAPLRRVEDRFTAALAGYGVS